MRKHGRYGRGTRSNREASPRQRHIGQRATQIGYLFSVALGLSDDEVRFYDALANNESAVKELTDETLKLIAHELTENLRRNITVDWAQRESVRATLRLMVKRILRKYKYPPDQTDAAIELVLQQAEAISESWG